ncbi:MAG: FxsA family protein [Gemmatimonadetes bacterium]|nr:FxsA family protein [Gemmatimonadota bacterium]NIQ54253.1 FxsA family protein [Gemmatimonadota bacterium]NIU74460.1 FxsA family protein [Gammaproteobacteria bacterium]NIX44434.1 FxsA family protein [Gemmatimonadota bacterium]NIY08652.1 FxsA family protein [Gemmatimonadota bacterium]
MFARLLAVFVLLPLAELALLIQIGRAVGLAWTLAIVVATGILGATLARRQGLRAWLAIQAELRDGRMPGAALVDGLLILIGGIVLLTPGILTDLAGFALLVPATRNVLKTRLRRRFQRAIEEGSASFTVIVP